MLLFLCGCDDQLCECDLNLTDYLVKKVEIVSTNSNKKSISDGNLIELSTSLSATSNLKKIAQIDIDTFVISIPTFDKKKYYQTSYVSNDKSTQDVNIFRYHLLYCSYYPIYHTTEENCAPIDGWEDKINILKNIIYSNDAESIDLRNEDDDIEPDVNPRKGDEYRLPSDDFPENTNQSSGPAFTYKMISISAKSVDYKADKFISIIRDGSELTQSPKVYQSKVRSGTKLTLITNTGISLDTLIKF
jgi:hypothetical protein